MAARYPAPRLLATDDDLGSFECRSRSQTKWLHNIARRAHSRKTARTYVVTKPGSPIVVGYYAWCMSGVSAEEAPQTLLRGAGRYPLHPVALLARLGVDSSLEGHGLGSWLLQDVVARSLDLSEQIGCLGLFVHAETEAATGFYTHHMPEFQLSPTNSSYLVLPLAHARKALQN